MHSTERAGNQIDRENNQADVHQTDQYEQRPNINGLVPFDVAISALKIDKGSAKTAMPVRMIASAVRFQQGEAVLD